MGNRRRRRNRHRRRFADLFVFNALERRRKEHDAVTIKVALAGNPNAGKTSLFNALTGQHQHIGNYPGVTVDKKTGYTEHDGMRIEFVDLPGTYSLTAYSLEEVVTRDFVLNEKPDLIVDVLDSTNLERNLYLLLQFQELGVPVIGALNMVDEAAWQGLGIDSKQLGTVLGVPLVSTVANRGDGVEELLDRIVEVVRGGNGAVGRGINYGREIEAERGKLVELLAADERFSEKYILDWVAIKLLEEDEDALRKVHREHRADQLVLRRAGEARKRIRKHFNQDCVVVVGEQRYAYIHGAVHETVRRSFSRDGRVSLTERIDRIVLNRYAGTFIFFLAMFFVYQVTFAIGNSLSDLLAAGFDHLGRWVQAVMLEGAVRDLVVEGVIGGVGGVITFLPLVLLLFLGLSFLEDSGYMARAAFVMDRFFHLFGLHGRSFIPFMIATGCAVPAVLSARTLVNPRDRKITILVTPLMMCGAKSPVIAMLAAAFFHERAALVFWFVWLAGWIIAFLIALLFRNTLFRGEAAPFVMELPPYRMPTLNGIATHMWDRSWMYLRKAGTIILAVSLVVWFLLYFPKSAEIEAKYAAEAEIVRTGVLTGAMAAQTGVDRETVPLSPEQIEAGIGRRLADLDGRRAKEELLHSYAGRIGAWIEPIFRPAGFDWKLSIGLFSGLAAKEVIISTMGIVYGIGDAEPNLEGSIRARSPLKSRMSSDLAYNPAVALALMFFVLIYVPCMPTLVVVRREMGSWKWSAFLALYTLVVAWVVAVAVYQAGNLVGLGA